MDSKNFILAFSVSFCILYVYQYFFDPHTEVQTAEIQKVEEAKPQNALSIIPPVVNKEESRKVNISSSSLSGHIYTLGNEIDTINLVNYKKTVNGDENVCVLGNNRYKFSIKFASNDSVKLPDERTLWSLENSTELTPATPIIMKWDNGEGIVFEKKISIDERFLITIDTTIRNTGKTTFKVKPHYLISKCKNDEQQQNWILHEGGVGYLGNSLEEKSFKDMQEDSVNVYNSIGGWAGLTDKYWLVAVIPSQRSNCIVKFSSEQSGNERLPLMTMVDDEVQVAPGESKTVRTNVFAGAKDIQVLDGYEKELGIKHFDLAVDYGYLYFMTKPLSYLLIMLDEYARNVGLAILLITILIKLLLFPLANKSYRSMRKMKDVQPKIKKIQTLYADDKQRLSEEMFALYKREKINPAGSCLPMLLQVPFMFALYKVMMISIEMRHAPFWGWIHDLSAPDPTSIFNLFGLLPFSVPSFLQIGAWPIIMGVTMYLQQAMSPQVGDAQQRKMMLMLPFIFTYMMSSLSVGLIIYWTFSNILQIIQQYAIEKIDSRTTRKK